MVIGAKKLLLVIFKNSGIIPRFCSTNVQNCEIFQDCAGRIGSEATILRVDTASGSSVKNPAALGQEGK